MANTVTGQTAETDTLDKDGKSRHEHLQFIVLNPSMFMKVW